MNPYYCDEHVQLYLGDMRQVLPALGVTADVVIADPPYGETAHGWDTWPPGWLQTAAEHSTALWCFGSWRVFGPRWAEFTEAGWKFAQDLVWKKPQGSGFTSDRFKRVHETLTHWYRGPWGQTHHNTPKVQRVGPAAATISRRTQPAHTGEIGPNVWVDDGTRLQLSVIAASQVREGRHPTEKPVSLLGDVITYSCPPGGLVVDPFAGSGSTLVAARELGRRAIGIEASEEYAEACARRLAQAPLPFLGGET